MSSDKNPRLKVPASVLANLGLSRPPPSQSLQPRSVASSTASRPLANPTGDLNEGSIATVPTRLDSHRRIREAANKASQKLGVRPVPTSAPLTNAQLRQYQMYGVKPKLAPFGQGPAFGARKNNQTRRATMIQAEIARRRGLTQSGPIAPIVTSGSSGPNTPPLTLGTPPTKQLPPPSSVVVPRTNSSSLRVTKKVAHLPEGKFTLFNENEKQIVQAQINDNLKTIRSLKARLPTNTKEVPNDAPPLNQNDPNFIQKARQWMNWVQLAIIWYLYTINDSNGTICLQYLDRNTKQSRLMRINEILFDENNEFDIDFNESIIRANGALAFKSIGKQEHLAPLRENNYYLISENPCRKLPFNTSNQQKMPRQGTPSRANNRPGISGQLPSAVVEGQRNRELELKAEAEQRKLQALIKAEEEKRRNLKTQLAAVQLQEEEEATREAALEREQKNAKNAAERQRIGEEQKRLQQQHLALERKKAALAAAKAKAEVEKRRLEEARNRAKDDIKGVRRSQKRSGSVSGLTTLSTLSSSTAIPNSKTSRRLLGRRSGSSGSYAPSTISSGNSNRPVNPTKRKRQTTMSGTRSCQKWKCTRKAKSR